MCDLLYISELQRLSNAMIATFGEVHRFGWDDWKAKGDKMVSASGKRTLSRESWEKLKARAPREVREMHPDAVHVDPKRFQFKLKTDAKTGVGQELAGVQTYNPELAGVLAVWDDPADKKTYVVNGHHRLDLAKRALAQKVLVRRLNAKTAEEARAKGALINIAEGKGTAIDAAKFLRDTGTTIADLHKTGVSVSGPVARDAVPLTNLDSGLFHKVTLGVLDVPRAIAVATHLPNHDDQRTLLAHIDREEKKTGKQYTPGAIAEAAKEMAATPKGTIAGTDGGLFGNDPEEGSLFLHRAELKNHIRATLAQQAKDFNLLGSKRRVGNVSAIGNVIDPKANKEAAKQTRGLVDDFDRSVNRSGAVSDAVNKLAARYAAVKSAADKERIKREAVELTRKLISEGMFTTLSEWVDDLVHHFSWQKGKRGGRYWLPEGKQDVPANRIYGAKAVAASKAGQGGKPAAGRVVTPKAQNRVAQAKLAVARDAHQAAAKPGSGATPEQIAWLKARLDTAEAEAKGRTPPPRVPKPPGFLDRAEKFPLIGGLIRRGRDAYEGLEDRYGGGMAKAIGVAALPGIAVPIPIPGVGEAITAAPVLAVAEANHQLRNLLGLNDDPKKKRRGALAHISAAKRKNPGHLVLERNGSELSFPHPLDAKKVAKAGVPTKMTTRDAEGHLRALLAAGHKITVVEHPQERKPVVPAPIKVGPFVRKGDPNPEIHRPRTEVRGKPIVAVTPPASNLAKVAPKPAPLPARDRTKPMAKGDLEAMAKAVDDAVVGPKRSLGWGYDTAKAKATATAAHQEIDDYARRHPDKVRALAKEVTGKDAATNEDAIRVLKAFVAESVSLLDRGGPSHGMSERSERARLGMRVLRMWLNQR